MWGSSISSLENMTKLSQWTLSLTQPLVLIFTDAFIARKWFGMAIVSRDIQIQWKLSYKCSIYKAEVNFKAFEYTILKVETSHNIIFSNSISSLINLRNYRNPTDITRKIKTLILEYNLLANSHLHVNSWAL